MGRHFRLPRFLNIACVVLISTILYTLKNSLVDLKSLPFKVEKFFNFENMNDYGPQNLSSKVQSERWIIVDGEDVTKEDVLMIQDVPGWTILVFGDNIRNYRNKRCTSCIFLTSASDMAGQHSGIPVSDFKMSVYLFVMSRGAKWIYTTSKITNLQTQLYGFDFGARSKGLLYGGQVTFDPERHFGVKDMSADIAVRNQHLSYTLGDYITPSIQSRWTTQHPNRPSGTDIGDNSCRLPRVFVPPKLYPISGLSGSLIQRRSFWVLLTLIEESSSLALWWMLLMRHLGEVIGSYPPSCSYTTHVHKNIEIDQDMNRTLVSLKCKENMPFHECGTFLATELQNRDLFTYSDLKLVNIWFDALSKIKFEHPKLQTQQKEAFISGPVHQVVFEQTKSNITLENPFKEICKSTPPSNSSASPMNDILLVVIFNYPTYYSNILFLNYIYRKYFTNILYCGSVLGNFGLFQRQYPHPVSFLEINELERGVYGYMCTSYAMEMGYNVKGYLQMSDDVLLNMWNIRDLPRDKIWFQSSIRKGNLKDRNVPNITPVMKDKTWWPWASSQWGVKKLRNLWAQFGLILKTSDKPKVDSFLQQLSRSFGKGGGAFYEASDIFYVPSKYRDNFSYFSTLFFTHNLFLEIAIPTMLCGLDDIKNIVRLQGRYLWYAERNINTMGVVFNVNQHFMHPWKLNPLMVHANAQDFFCKKYFANLGRN